MRSCHNLALAAALALPACQTSFEDNENSPYYVLPPGTRLILNQTLTIPAEQVAVWLQDGRVVPANDANMYYPHCKLELRRRLATVQTVAPDEFVVTRVTRSLLHSVHAPATGKRWLVAAGFGINLGGGDGPSIQTFATRMDLGSDRQPEVLRLTCGQWGYPHEGRHVNIGEIRGALRTIFALRIPGTA